MNSESRIYNLFLLTVTALLCMWSCQVLQAAEPQDEYVRVNHVDELSEGDVVIIANAAYGYAMGTRQATHNRPGVKVKVNNGCVAPTDDVQLITLGKTAGAWTLAVADGQWLCATDNKTQQLKTTSTRSNLMQADISIDTAGNACIQFKGSKPCAMVMRFSHQTTAFNCYTSLTAVDSLQLYRRTRTVETLTLDGENAGAADVIAENKGCRVQKLVLHRRLAADGGWHTLCLPFALTGSDIQQVLKGADVEEFCAVTADADGKSVLHFRKVENTTAGKPYLVRMLSEVTDPVFADKTLTAVQPVPDVLDAGSHISFTFVGTYAPVRLQGTDYRFLESSGTRFVVPNGDGQIGATRAYFIFGQPTASARCQFSSNVTGISLPVVTVGKHHINTYNLYGQPVNSETVRGIVIVEGKKILKK